MPYDTYVFNQTTVLMCQLLRVKKISHVSSSSNGHLGYRISAYSPIRFEDPNRYGMAIYTKASSKPNPGIIVRYLYSAHESALKYPFPLHFPRPPATRTCPPTSPSTPRAPTSTSFRVDPQ
jgi:hypothetical protein